MTGPSSKDPLHGVTLARMLEELVERRGWEDLARRIQINCFANDPSIKSSLKFLRRTPWARERVELLYLEDLRKRESRRRRNQLRSAQRAYRRTREGVDDPGSPERGSAGPAEPADPRSSEAE